MRHTYLRISYIFNDYLMIILFSYKRINRFE